MTGNTLAPYAAQLICDKVDTSHGSDPNAVAQALGHGVVVSVGARFTSPYRRKPVFLNGAR